MQLEPGEAPEGALCRELHEELGIGVAPGDLRPLTFASYAYDDFHLIMPVFGASLDLASPHQVHFICLPQHMIVQCWRMLRSRAVTVWLRPDCVPGVLIEPGVFVKLHACVLPGA